MSADREGAGVLCLAARSSTSFATATMSTLPEPSSGSLSTTHTSAGTIRSEARFDLANALKFGARRALLLRDQHQPLALARIRRGATADSASGHSSRGERLDRGERDHLAADLGEALGAALDGHEALRVDA